MSADKPRDYQLKSFDLIKDEFRNGYRKVLLYLATGGGKTFVFCHLVKASVAKGKKCLIVVRGRKLVDQASKRLFREGVDHGVLMSGHWNYKPNAPVQVCSIDTLIARRLQPDADLIIIDEAHLATSEGYVNFISLYPRAFVIPVTATPWTEKGLRHIADRVVHPISMMELIEQGYLTGAKYFAPDKPDLSGVRVSKSTKDYVTDELEAAMISSKLTGNIILHWKKHVVDKPTLCFAVNINHSKILTERFNAAGIPAEHCDADMSDAEREEVIKRLESGETKVVCNVGIFCTGVDIPNLGAIVMARPTKSRNLFVQQAGRGTRPVYANGFDLDSPEGRLDAIAQGPKPHFILLDHAGNISEHDLPTEEPEVDLDGQKTSFEKKSRTCQKCFRVYTESRCPDCGTEAPAGDRVADLQEASGELKEITEEDLVLMSLRQLRRDAKKNGRKAGWVYFKLIDRVGFELAKPHLPQWVITKFQASTIELFANSRFQGLANKS